jgi:hypothetical protein
VIDEHDVVLRFNTAPTKSFEEFTGAKTTFRLLNRKAADTMLEVIPSPRPLRSLSLWRILHNGRVRMNNVTNSRGGAFPCRRPHPY